MSEPARPWAPPPALAAPEPSEDIFERPLLGLSLSTLGTGEALRALSFGTGFLVLAMFLLPWGRGSEEAMLWSWSSLRGAAAPASLRFALWLPLVAGLSLLTTARLALAPLARAALLLALGAVSTLIVVPYLRAGLTRGAGLPVASWLQIGGTAALALGCTLRALRTDTRLGRAFILVGALALIAGYLVPSETFSGNSYLSWVLARMNGRQRASDLIMVIWPLLLPTAALGALSLLGRDRQERGTGFARTLAVLFVLWAPFWMLLQVGIEFLQGGHDIVLRTFAGLKIALYLALISLWLNHGAVAVSELGPGRHDDELRS